LYRGTPWFRRFISDVRAQRRKIETSHAKAANTAK
jgi:hypothetical protein